MFQRGFASQPRDTFFSFKSLQPREDQPRGERPLSSATIFDTDFEDDASDVEDYEEEQRPQYVEDIQYASDLDEDPNSPRMSYRSVCTSLLF
jgi:hypothetical protein